MNYDTYDSNQVLLENFDQVSEYDVGTQGLITSRSIQMIESLDSSLLPNKQTSCRNFKTGLMKNQLHSLVWGQMNRVQFQKSQ
jgi:hypothetical protein